MGKQKAKRIRDLIQRLLAEIEEEDIGISLFSTFYQTEHELYFFCEEDRDRVVHILETLSEDSHRHKDLIARIINGLEGLHREE